MKPKRFSPKQLALSGMIAALYVALTALSSVFGLSSGAVQVRLSEILCVLPVFSPAFIPGLGFGCFLANLILGGTVFDVILGTAATVLGAVGASLLSKHPVLSSLPTILANGIIIPCVLVLSGVGGWGQYFVFAGLVSAGEVVSCGVLGTLLLFFLGKNAKTRKLLKK